MHFPETCKFLSNIGAVRSKVKVSHLLQSWVYYYFSNDKNSKSYQLIFLSSLKYHLRKICYTDRCGRDAHTPSPLLWNCFGFVFFWHIVFFYCLTDISTKKQKAVSEAGIGYVNLWKTPFFQPSDHTKTMPKHPRRTNVSPLFLHYYSVLPPYQTRWSSVPNSVWVRLNAQNRHFCTDFGAELQRRYR